MCGRYYIETEDMDQQLKQIIEEAERRQSDPELRAAMRLGEIYPTNIVPILTSQGPELMKWGYSGYRNRIINARSETAMDKAMFRRSLMERRCLVPASGYYEWPHQGRLQVRGKICLLPPGKAPFHGRPMADRTKWPAPGVRDPDASGYA